MPAFANIDDTNSTCCTTWDISTCSESNPCVVTHYTCTDGICKEGPEAPCIRDAECLSALCDLSTCRCQ
jgi:hypothetical protein